MQPADNIRRLIDESQISSSAQADRRILADALADLENRRVPSDARSGVWRILMQSKTVRLAAAAVIVIAVLFGLQFLGGSGVTFAQAIQPILDANTAILDIVIGAEDSNTPVIRDMIMGSYIRRTLSNMPESVSIIDIQAGRILSLDESKKQAYYTDLKGLPPIPNYLDHLKTILVTLQDNPHFVTEDLGAQQIDGHDAVGFCMKHPKAEIVLWADSETGLPVRIEHKEGQLTVICKNLQFNVSMDKSLFSMEVPEGYALQQTQLDLLGSTEADFIEGLRVLAELYGDGQFPDNVTLEYFLSQVPAMQKKEKGFKLSAEEDTAIGVKVQKHILFLRFFRGEGKWYYRGRGVRLGDASTAIFWYRPKDSQTYRVIYGDLHVEDVAGENLPEPLDADDVAEVKIRYQQWSKPEFVGTQEDYWLALPDGRIRVKAYLTLMKGPAGVSSMPVKLPYPSAPLEAVLLEREPLTFQQTGDGTYNVELPLDKLASGPAKLLFQWHVSLSDLPSEGDILKTVLKSVIPVVSYVLKVGVDPQSSFELTQEPKGMWVTPFTGGAPERPTTEFGSCGLLLRPRK